MAEEQFNNFVERLRPRHLSAAEQAERDLARQAAHDELSRKGGQLCASQFKNVLPAVKFAVDDKEGSAGHDCAPATGQRVLTVLSCFVRWQVHSQRSASASRCGMISSPMWTGSALFPSAPHAYGRECPSAQRIELHQANGKAADADDAHLL